MQYINLEKKTDLCFSTIKTCLFNFSFSAFVIFWFYCFTCMFMHYFHLKTLWGLSWKVLKSAKSRLDMWLHSFSHKMCCDSIKSNAKNPLFCQISGFVFCVIWRFRKDSEKMNGSQRKKTPPISNMMFVNLKDNFASQWSRNLSHNCCSKRLWNYVFTCSRRVSDVSTAISHGTD